MRWIRKPVLLTASLLLALGCGAKKQSTENTQMTTWERHPFAPQGFEGHALIASDGSTAFVGGRLAGEPSSGDRAVVLRWRKGVVSTVLDVPGWVVCMAEQGGKLWAVVGSLDGGATPRRRLVHSPDGGENWTPAGPIPDDSAIQLAAVSATELWLHDVDNLLVTRDGGATWTRAAVPGQRNHLNEQILAHAGAPMVAGTGIMVPAEGDQAWTTVEAEAQIQAVDGSAVAALVAGKRRLGTWSGDAIEWGAELPEGGVAVASLHVADKQLRVLAYPSAKSSLEVFKGWVYLHSSDGGQNWSTSRVEGPVSYRTADFNADGSGFVLARDGGLWVLGSRN